MTIAVGPVAGTARVVVLADDPGAVRGRPAEYRRVGISIVRRESILAALTEVVHDPSAVLVVSSELPCDGLGDLLDLAVATCGSSVVLGLTADTRAETVSAAMRSGVRATVDLPLSPLRLSAMLRATPVRDTASSPITVGGLTVDSGRHVVSWTGLPVDLTPREFAVLEELAGAHPRIVSLDELALRYHGSAADPRGAVRVVVTHVRARLAGVGGAAASACVETIRGVGYRIAG